MELERTEGQNQYFLELDFYLFEEDKEYFIDTVSCSNVTCDCGNLSLVVRDIDSSFKAIYRLNSADGNLKLLEVKHSEGIGKKDYEALFHKLADEISDEELRLFRYDYRKDKLRQLETFNVRDIEYEFEELHYRDPGIMVFFDEVFEPGYWEVELEGETYKVIDSHCKQPGCDCGDVFIQAFGVNRTTRGAEKVGELVYNLNNGKKKFKGDGANRVEIIESIVKDIFLDDETMNAKLKYRSSIVKLLYAKDKNRRTKLEIEKTRKIIKSKRAKVGRNAPCPCGSGKKYKKCCMNKG